MRAFIALTRLRLNDVWRKKSSIGFLTAFPIALLLIVGLVFANGHPFEQRRVVVVGDAEPYRRSLARFEEVKIDSEANERVAFGKLRSRMANAVVATSDGHPRLWVGPRDRLFGNGLARELGDVPVAVLEVPRFGYVHYLFPGALAFSVLVSGMFGVGSVMLVHRESGFLKKLATTPLRKSCFILAQISARMLLVMLQIALTMATAMLAFEVRITPAAVISASAVSLVGLIAFLGVGFALACVVRTADLLSDAIMAANIPLILCSEIFFPLDSLPRPLAVVGELLPSTEMVRLLRSILVYGVNDVRALGPGLGVLALWALASFAMSVALFRWHR
jgi:ABC-type multidrug transport system permease subunit